ncbi:YdiU family protein [Pleurocapsa sp. PCC 7319]|uniref:protein adenylyltransferase SelO n=1 Tax=Pleurocapsa sp. PCC 7319 TaxID=118161 RepID=UPI0003486D9C|nr:YdiU family protein [Pleurocapsa sp. PCC 7319]
MKPNLNPFLNLEYEPVMEKLGDDYYDVVAAAEFPAHFLRYRNDLLLPLIGLEATSISDADFIEAFGKFQGVRPYLALRYHGYQFGAYNPFLGDGRGFLYGQVRDVNGNLVDLGTKGSGRTPYSRSADGRLTLKGGVREVLAAEALHQLGVKTSRCLSLIETGESLWRGDEPSPTRSSVMVRFSSSHIRFGTFERLHYIQRPDYITKLLDSVIAVYYPDIPETEDKYSQFYAALVNRTAELAAQWMAAGFCHGVLNTDNMSITGESFDYGPYAFIPTYNPRFTAASFDYGGRYSYGNQPHICKFNLEMLQLPLAMVTEQSNLEAGLAQYDDCYQKYYQKLMLQKLGFEASEPLFTIELLAQTIELLRDTEISYHGFFAELAQGFNYGWREDSNLILENATFNHQINSIWRDLYHKCLNQLPAAEMEKIGDRLTFNNPQTALLRTVIESVWQSISEDNNWQPFYDLISKLQTKE